MTDDVIIIGAGLAGLCCARTLQQHKIPYQIYEASDAVGGRIRTDRVDGFRLDRGFQVFLPSYPEAQAVLDYEALKLHSFLPGASVRYTGKFHNLTDPWRKPLRAIGAAFSPIGSFADKLRVAKLRSRSLQGTVEDRFADPEMTTLQYLQELGFSQRMIDRFFRPFLGGIFLDAELSTSSRMLLFVFRMFSQSLASLPEAGMQAIPEQIAAGLDQAKIHLQTPVVRLRQDCVTLANGEEIPAKAVVVAVEAPQAAALLDAEKIPIGQSVTCLYYAANESPTRKPILMLNGDSSGPINNLCVPNLVCPSYAPAGQNLISITVLGQHNDHQLLQQQVEAQLTEWYGAGVHSWQHLRTYTIDYALPNQTSPALAEPTRPVRREPGLYVCGDYLDNASINGAMVSGRRAAEAIVEDFTQTNESL